MREAGEVHLVELRLDGGEVPEPLSYSAYVNIGRSDIPRISGTVALPLG
jgi:hypothetical protein